ncbi:transporter [Sphingomonas nostoxanthinifaciens]|uniref:transporter n=1 Tax=Sphingomonas nostoxanthinifaciens TaxID=2872652 RepID=UPI001CC1C72F|nr:transporter [Sphingomonas nostoxanthinifaciens]UAK25474.1 transporter [Sphingomonas nostoxanthinifaciens]
MATWVIDGSGAGGAEPRRRFSDDDKARIVSEAMVWMRKHSLIVIGLLVSGPAFAQDEPRFCPSRPSLGSSACTTEPGQVHLEVSAVDRQHDRGADQQDDSLLLGDFQARIGVGPATEGQVGWTPYGFDRSRQPGGPSQRLQGTGDLALGVRQNLHNPDGKGLSYGIEASLTLPTGSRAIGEGDWGVGVDVPVSYQVSDLLSVTLTAEIDAAADEDRAGRHFAGDTIATVGFHPTNKVTLYTEAEFLRDLDPSGRSSKAYAAEGLAIRVSKRASLWAETVTGLNTASTDLRAFAGFSVLF